MDQPKGFSLIEVLISLVFITSASVLLLNQHWQLSQLLNQLLKNSRALVELDNQHEKSPSLRP